MTCSISVCGRPSGSQLLAFKPTVSMTSVSPSHLPTEWPSYDGNGEFIHSRNQIGNFIGSGSRTLGFGDRSARHVIHLNTCASHNLAIRARNSAADGTSIALRKSGRSEEKAERYRDASLHITLFRHIL